MQNKKVQKVGNDVFTTKCAKFAKFKKIFKGILGIVFYLGFLGFLAVKKFIIENLSNAKFELTQFAE